MIIDVNLPEQHPLLNFAYVSPPTIREHSALNFLLKSLKQFIMSQKTAVIATVSHLNIYSATREIITVNGTKTYKDGALVLQSEVGGTTAINLTGKELDHLAKLAGIRVTGRQGWNLFADLISINMGADSAKARLSIEEYKAGDEYLLADKKTVEKHKVDGTNVRVEAVTYRDTVRTQLMESTIKQVKELNAMSMPAVELIAENVPAGVN